MSMLSARARRIVHWLPSQADVDAFRTRMDSAPSDQTRAALVAAVERRLRLKVPKEGTCPRCDWVQWLEYDGGPVHPFFCRRCHDDTGMDLVPLLIDGVPLVTKDELPLPTPTSPMQVGTCHPPTSILAIGLAARPGSLAGGPSSENGSTDQPRLTGLHTLASQADRRSPGAGLAHIHRVAGGLSGAAHAVGGRAVALGLGTASHLAYGVTTAALGQASAATVSLTVRPPLAVPGSEAGRGETEALGSSSVSAWRSAT